MVEKIVRVRDIMSKLENFDPEMMVAIIDHDNNDRVFLNHDIEVVADEAVYVDGAFRFAREFRPSPEHEPVPVALFW